jgi:hypothetical protein
MTLRGIDTASPMMPLMPFDRVTKHKPLKYLKDVIVAEPALAGVSDFDDVVDMIRSFKFTI